MAYVQVSQEWHKIQWISHIRVLLFPLICHQQTVLLNYLKKIGAVFVCLYHNGNTKEIRGKKKQGCTNRGQSC